MKNEGKYSAESLIPMFRMAAELRNKMAEAGFTDNGGAIHSAERILGILGERLKYPGLRHPINYKNKPYAEFSVKAWEAYNKTPKGKVLLEHVSPVRDFTRKAIEKITNGATDRELSDFIKENYRLVVLTPEETLHLNKQNRSKMDSQRLEKAGITVIKRPVDIDREPI